MSGNKGGGDGCLNFNFNDWNDELWNHENQVNQSSDKWKDW